MSIPNTQNKEISNLSTNQVITLYQLKDKLHNLIMSGDNVLENVFDLLLHTVVAIREESKSKIEALETEIDNLNEQINDAHHF